MFNVIQAYCKTKKNLQFIETEAQYLGTDGLPIDEYFISDKLHQTRLSPTEQYTHLSLWAMLSAPLLIGCDLTRIDPFTYNLLANHEVLAIDQDALGKQAVRVFDQKDIQIWVKELTDGSRAVAVFNLSDENRAVRFDWADLGLSSDYTKLRDVWRQQDLGKLSKSFDTEVLAHGVRLLRVE